MANNCTDGLILKTFPIQGPQLAHDVIVCSYVVESILSHKVVSEVCKAYSLVCIFAELNPTMPERLECLNKCVLFLIPVYYSIVEKRTDIVDEMVRSTLFANSSFSCG